MPYVKPWYQSKTIITQLVGMSFLLAAHLKILPDGLEQDTVVTAAIAVTTVLTVIFRGKASAALGTSAQG